MANREFPLEVRIPVYYFDMLADGEITGSMLLTMAWLYRWSDWDWGKAKKVSAQGLTTVTNDAYHRNTYQDALVRWEQMGHITRHLTLGSHKHYPVTIHNYRKRYMVRDKETGESVWKTCMINRWKTVTYEEFLNGVRAEALDEAPAEALDEALAEAPTEGVERTCIYKQDNQQEVQQVNLHDNVQEGGGSSAPPPIAAAGETIKQKPLWEAWDEDVDGIPAPQIRLALLYHLSLHPKYNPKPYWRKQRLSLSRIRLKARELVDDMEYGWQPPEWQPPGEKPSVPDDDAAAAAGISALEDEEDFGKAPVQKKGTIEDIQA